MKVEMDVCDNCGRPPNGDSPDFLYAAGGPQTPCWIHDLCNECIDRQHRYVKENRAELKCPVYEKSKHGKTHDWSAVQ